MDKNERAQLGRAINNLLLLLLFGGFLLGIYTQIESRLIFVKEITIKSNEIPPSFDGMTIAFISDIHHGIRFSKKKVHHLVDRVNFLMPDLIILGGDYVDGSGNFIEPVWEELSRLTPMRFGVFGVLGEGDYWEGTTLTVKAMQDAGVIPLRNSGVWLDFLGDRIHLGGVGDFTVDTTHLTGALRNTKKEDFSILVSHNPNYFLSSAMGNREEGTVDLFLSGHTHGGYNLLRRILPKRNWDKPFVNEEGLYYKKNTAILISSGTGSESGEIRFLTPARIYLITLKRDSGDTPVD